MSVFVHVLVIKLFSHGKVLSTQLLNGPKVKMIKKAMDGNKNRNTEIDIPKNILRVDKYAFITFYGLMFKRANSNPLERK